MGFRRWWRGDAKAVKKCAVYCFECGLKLVDNLTIDRFNEYTGEPILRYPGELTCPDRFCRSKDW